MPKLELRQTDAVAAVGTEHRRDASADPRAAAAARRGDGQGLGAVPVVSHDGRRVVLVKPGDILMIGNLDVAPDDAEAFEAALEPLREMLGIPKILVFADDIDLAVTSSADAFRYTQERYGPALAD